jgi:hypothetical protein
VANALCLWKVIGVQDEQDDLAVGRYVQVFYSAKAVKIFDGEGAFGGSAGNSHQQKAE